MFLYTLACLLRFSRTFFWCSGVVSSLDCTGKLQKKSRNSAT